MKMKKKSKNSSILKRPKVGYKKRGTILFIKIADNSLNLEKEKDAKTQEAVRATRRHGWRRISLKHIIIKMSKAQATK